MFRRMLRTKIHRATVTHADLHYEGSVTIPPELLATAGIFEYEAVWIWDVSNGNRLETYAISGQKGSHAICVNGAAAHLIHPGDVVIIAAFGMFPEDEARRHTPRVVFVDENNRMVSTRAEIPGPELPNQQLFGETSPSGTKECYDSLS